MKHRILLVEDDAPVGAVVQEILCNAGYEVLFKAGLADVKRLDDFSFSVVISDFHLLASDGSEVIAYIRSKVPGIPALMMSGHGSWAANHCANCGLKGVSFIEKPFSTKQLLDTVNALLLTDVLWPFLTKI